MISKLQGKNFWLIVIAAVLAAFPLFSDSRTMTILLTQIFIFSILAMSYDILLGYTGIVSFGHAMFFGVGAYTTAVILDRMEPTLGMFLLSIAAGMVIAGIISFIAGLLTLRLKSHFYAMFTLALSGLFLVAAGRSLTDVEGQVIDVGRNVVGRGKSLGRVEGIGGWLRRGLTWAVFSCGRGGVGGGVVVIATRCKREEEGNEKKER